MNSHIFVLFGDDTRELVDIGYGPLFREHWALQEQPGPRMDAERLGGKRHGWRYLYPQHLELLYGRFRQANPGGVRMGPSDRVEMAYERERGLTGQQVDELYERRLLYVTVTSTDEVQGYPHLRRYLPEVFEPEVVAAMGADLWLDAWLLDQAIARGHVPDSRERHPRWSPEWRAYCDAVASGAAWVGATAPRGAG